MTQQTVTPAEADAMIALMGGENVLWVVDNFPADADPEGAPAEYLGPRAAYYEARDNGVRIPRVFDWAAKWEAEVLADGTGVLVRIFNLGHYDRAEADAPTFTFERRTQGALNLAAWLYAGE